jgi:hypothetical protein
MEEETVSEDPRFYIELEESGDSRRSMSVMIEGRKCYEHRPAGASHLALDSDPHDGVLQIKDHCAQTADYLLEDSPLKEAIFRVILAGGNEPVTAQQVSEAITLRWALSAYLRDASARVIGRLLEHSESYGIVALGEPEPEPELMIADVAGSPDDEDGDSGPEGAEDAEQQATEEGESEAAAP